MRQSHALQQQDYVQDNKDVSAHTVNAQRRLLALVAQESAPLPDIGDNSDLEAFVMKYRLTASSFA